MQDKSGGKLCEDFVRESDLTADCTVPKAVAPLPTVVSVISARAQKSVSVAPGIRQGP
jgi:hypothetical protein